MTVELLLFYVLLVVVAFLYASVGHGGASGYLALMALFGIAPAVMKPSALLLNLFVSLTAFIQFYRSGHFQWRLFWPFALASVPLSFLGGMITIDADLYKKMLGVLLLAPVARFGLMRTTSGDALQTPSLPAALTTGGVIGFLSGLIGIGGGILLSPMMLLMRWADPKQSAAVSALFIFVNSAAGISGQFTKGIAFTSDLYWYVSLAFCGGLAGSYFGAKKFNQRMIQRLLALVLLVAAIKLLLV